MTTKFINDVKKHEILKEAAIYSYDVKNKPIPKGYKLILESEPSETGFYACALQKGDEVIIAFRGTDDNKDKFRSDRQLFFKKMPEQSEEAKAFCQKVMLANKGCKFFVTGHSLGGALAQIVGALFNLCTATFNPAGVSSMLRREPLKSYSDNIINYHTPKDLIKKWMWFDDIGTNYVVDSYSHSINAWEHHKAENMKPLSTAVPMTRGPHKSIQDHKENIINSIETAKNYISPKLQAAKSMLNKASATGFAASAETCPGSYYVEGYTRSDGTEVLGYERNCYVHGNGKIRKKRVDEMTPEELDNLLERLI